MLMIWDFKYMASNFFKSNQLPSRKLETACGLADRFINEKINTYLDEMENAILNDKGEFSWTRDEAKKVLGRQLALAYAFGYLDKYENKT